MTKAYFDDGQGITLYCKDSTDMSEVEDESVDLIATDPPYQLTSTSRPRLDQSAEGSYGREVPFSRQQSRIKGFMGKEWDVLPPVEVWQECLRVLKPGAFAFIMTTTRQDSLCQILSDLTHAGFQMGFSSIYWAYASGFPKAQNISKAVDRRLGVEREKTGEKKEHAQKGVAIAEERTAIGAGSFGEGRAEELTRATSPPAKALDGSYGGFQPKPAVEVILVAMKPLSEKTFVGQALKNRKGITWLDDCRIPYENEKRFDSPISYGQKKASSGFDSFSKSQTEYESVPSGRFPANLLVSDDVLNDGENKRSGGIYKSSHKTNKIFNSETDWEEPKTMYADSGSFSRYFDLDKWFEERIRQLPESIQRTFPFLIVPKASKSEKNEGIGAAVPRTKHGSTPRKNEAENKSSNPHPTVKPIKLMSYLITLGSRQRDMVVDPFIGTGSTAIACQILGRSCTGYEINPEYCEIAKRRLSIYRQRVMSL